MLSSAENSESSSLVGRVEPPTRLCDRIISYTFGKSTPTSMATNDIFTSNPYESHPSLTATEAEVLWEYAKLAQQVRMVRGDNVLNTSLLETSLYRKVTQKTRSISEEPDHMLLARLRVLEKKMGLVLTLVCVLSFDFVRHDRWLDNA